MPSPLKEHWSEFDWEQELRKDDARVNAYFQELPRFIDLPAEDEIIYRHIQRKKSLAPTGEPWPAKLPPKEELPPEEAEEEEERKRWDEEWQKRPGASIYILCGRIVRKFCTVFAEKATCPEESESVVKILTILGRIMARVTDVIELAPGEMPALTIALCKRFVADTNEILGLMEKLGTTDEETAEILHLAREEMLHLREDALAIIRETRNGKNS